MMRILRRVYWRLHQLYYWWRWDLLWYLHRKVLPNERIVLKFYDDGTFDMIIKEK